MSDESLITRRPATEADREWARQLHHRVVRDVVERQFGSWDEDQQDRFFANDWNGGIDVVYRGYDENGQPKEVQSRDEFFGMVLEAAGSGRPSPTSWLRRTRSVLNL